MKPYTVLVVDDNLTNLRMISDYLVGHGLEVLSAMRGSSALGIAEYGGPDLILLDGMMPDMDGFEVCRRLKANPKTAHILVIFMTALADETSKLKGFEIGAVDYLTKPVQLTEMFMRINLHLRLRKQAQELEAQNVRLQISQQIARRISSILDLDRLLLEVVQLLHQTFNYYYVSIWLIQDETDQIVLQAEVGRDHTPLHGLGSAIPILALRSIIAQVCRTGQWYLANQVARDPLYLHTASSHTQAELTLPLVTQQQVLGVLDIQSDQANSFMAVDITLLQTIAGQVSMAVTNATLFAQTQSALRETEGLFKAARSILGTDNIETICHSLVADFRELVPALSISLFVMDNEQQKVIFSQATRQTSYQELMQGITGMVFKSKQPVISLHADDGIEPETTKARRKKDGDCSLLVVPLVTPGGEVVGTIAVAREIGQTFTSHDVDLLMALTTQAAAAIENVRLFKDAQESKEVAEFAIKQARGALRESEGLFKAARSILGANDIETICHNLVANFNNLIDADGVVLYLVDHELKKVTLVIDYAFPTQFLTYDELLEGIAGLVFQSKQPIISQDADDGIEPAPMREKRKKSRLGPLMVLPLLGQSQVIGVITPWRKIGRSYFTLHDVDLLMALTTQAAAAIENVRLFKAMEEAKTTAEAANKAKSVFLANMSHELRTPLNAVLGFSQLLQKDGQLTPSQAQKLHIINRSGEHLLSLINDVLELSKIEAGRVVLHETEFDLRQLLVDLEAMFQLRVQEKGVWLEVTCAPDVPVSLRADVGKLRQVLINLLGNAVKFTTAGKITLQVQVLEQGAGWVQLQVSVTDTGYGISPDELGILFEAFAQTESGRKAKQGSGLGLTISQQFVRLMGGELRVKSELGVGSCFEFDFEAAVLSLEAVGLSNGQSVKRVIGGEYRVLVVDDKADNRDLLREVLEAAGFIVREAEHGVEAIAICEAWSPHCMLLDIRMPVMDGYETARRLRERGAELVIIAVTASAFEEERAGVLEVGCNDFIRKPVRVEVLWEKLRQHVGVNYEYKQDTTGLIELTVPTTLPPAEIAQLHEAAQTGNYTRLVEIVQQVQTLDPQVGQQLLQWVEDFEYDKILAWGQ